MYVLRYRIHDRKGDTVPNIEPSWNSHRGRALAIHYSARRDTNGLTDFDVIERAAPLGGLGDPSTEHKRVGELRTEYDPPLIEPVTDSMGRVVERPGRHRNTLRGAYRITDAGKAAYLRMRPKN